jgi:hypothetical protein
MSSRPGTRIPEALGFGVLGATIGAVVCGVAGGALSHHTSLGMTTGATLLICLSKRARRDWLPTPAGKADLAPPGLGNRPWLR